MIVKVIYANDGRIERVSTGAEFSFDFMEEAEPNSFTVEGNPNLETDYVTFPEGVPTITTRPEFPPPNKTEISADGIDEALFSFPFPVEFYVDGVFAGEDDTLEISSNHPDEYDVTVNYWPYLPYAVTIVAT